MIKSAYNRARSSVSGKRTVLVLALVCVLWVGAYGLRAQPSGDYQVIRGFEVPEFDRDNRLRSKLFGELARILPSGLVDITSMRIDFFNDDREVEMRVTAETCLYDRVTRSAESETRVRIARPNMIISGQGFTWNAEDGKFEIHDDARVVLKGALASAEKEGLQ